MKKLLTVAMAAAAFALAAFNAYADPVSIRLLFVYDAAAVDYLEGQGNTIDNFAQNAVARMNAVLANSRLTDYFTYEFAGATQTQVRESNLTTAYNRGWRYLCGTEDDAWDGVLEERTAKHADVVVNLVYTGTSGGLTGQSHPYTGTTPEYAINYAGSGFSVCSIQTAELEVSGQLGQFQVLSHEVAHTLGCGHSDTQDNQSGQQSASYSFGYQFKYPGTQNYALLQNSGYNAWYGCTVMAYKEHFFKNADGTYMTRADALAEAGWTDSDEGTKFWDNTDGGYSGYGKGVFNYCNMLPYFSSPDLYFVTMEGGVPNVKTAEELAQYNYAEGTYVPMGDATHNNRQVLIDNCGYASRWHLGVKFSKSGDASVVNGASDKITLSALSDNCSVYYTTDGTEPTKANGTLYTAPISLTQTTTIKARSYDANDNAGDVFTREYSVLPLAAALGNTALTWTTSSPAWYVDSGVARSAVINSDGVTSTLSTVITGPATLSFEYRTELMDSDVFEVTVGSQSVLTATDYNSDWRSSGEISIPEGSQTVTFSFTVNQNLASINNAAVRNVSVVYAYDPSEEPDDPVEPTYTGPAPTATWVTGEFEDAASDHGGYSIALNSNTIDSEGNIEISSESQLGATIDLTSGDCTNATVLVQYSLPSSGAPVANAVPLSMFDNYDMGAVATSAGAANVTGYYLNNGSVVANYPFSTSAPAMSEDGFMMLETWAINVNHLTHGTAFYSAESIAGLSGGLNTTLRFAGANNRVTATGIGGPTRAGAKPWAGMKIKAIAVFANSWLEPSDLANFKFPEAEEPGEEIPEGAVASVVYNGEVVYYNTVMAALTAVYMGQSDTPVVKVYDGSTTDYSGLGFTYDAATQTYTMLTAVAKIHTGIIESEFATLAEACATAQEEGVSVVILLKAFAEIGESVPAGWVYVTPEDSDTTYGTLTLGANEIPNTVCKMPLTQENVHLSSDGEWAVVGASPIYVTLGTATNAFTLSFDADIPEGFGTLLSWDSVLGTTVLDSRVVITNDAAKQVIWRKANGTLSSVDYTTSELIPPGEHYIELNWVHNSGATIKVDGETYYASGNLKFTDYLTSRLAFGGSALGGPDDVLAGLKVKNLNIRFGKTPTEPDEEAAGYPVLDYVTRLDGTIYHGNDENRAVITNWQTQITGVAKRPVPEGKADADFSTIDVLFVYDTPGKAYVESNESAWNGASALEVYSAKATAKMNQILCTTDMDTNFWFRMVGVHTVDGTGGTLNEILGKCEGLTGEYKHVLELRDRYGADVIVCPSPNGGGIGGLARLNTLDEIKRRGQNAAYHFATVLLNYSQTHAWVHEIGHNMSLNHYPPANFDPANTWRGLGFQHKIAVDGTSMSSVMAEQGYADFCGGFSSKNHIYHGSMLSLSNHLDSTGVLLEAAPYVSQWRSTRVPETQEIKCSVTYGSYLTGDTAFELSYPDPDAEIHYMVWGENNNEYQTYNGPFTVTADGKNYAYIDAYVITNGAQSATSIVAYNPFNSEVDTLLGSPKLPWTTVASIDGSWQAASGNEYLEIADSFSGSRSSESTLSTTVVGPDTLSFQHSEKLIDCPFQGNDVHSFPDSSFTVWVDNEPVYMLRGATNTIGSWVSTDIAIPEGTHKVEFIYTHRSGLVSGETVRIKSVSLASASVVDVVTPENIDTYDVSGMTDEEVAGLVFVVTYTPDGAEEETTANYAGILAKGENGEVALNPVASVDGVTVMPQLDDEAEEAYDADGETLKVKAIPGLWYQTIYGDALTSGGVGGDNTGATKAVQATKKALTLEAPKGGAVRFYQIRVAPKK